MITHPFRTIIGPAPDEWDTVPLREVVSRTSAGDWGEDRNDVAMAVLRSTNFTNTRALDYTDVAKRCFEVKRADAFDLKRGDILLERSGGGPTQPVGRIVVAERDLPGFGFSNFVQRLRVDESAMNPDFVAWCLYRLHQCGVVERLQHQTTQMRNLDFRDYLRVVLPRPPRPQQDRIAELLSAVDRAEARLATLLESLDTVRRSLIERLFTQGTAGPRPEVHSSPIGDFPATWDVVRLHTLIDRIEAGTSPRCEGHPAREGRWGVLKVSAVSWDAFDETENKELPSGMLPDPNVRVNVGDLIVSRANTTGLTAAAQIVRRLTAKLLLCDKTWRVIPKKGIDQEWLALLLKSQCSRRQIEAFATGTSDSMKNISRRDFGRLWVPLPTEREREAAVDAHRTIQTYRDAAEAELQSITALRRSMLRNLLTGTVRVREDVVA